VLHHFAPPTTTEEIRAAATQYVRKVGGITRPTAISQPAFALAVDEIAAATERLLAALPSRGEPRTREGELQKARLRFAKRAARSVR
jgi:hypothetical protein